MNTNHSQWKQILDKSPLHDTASITTTTQIFSCIDGARPADNSLFPLWIESYTQLSLNDGGVWYIVMVQVTSVPIGRSNECLTECMFHWFIVWLCKHPVIALCDGGIVPPGWKLLISKYGIIAVWICAYFWLFVDTDVFVCVSSVYTHDARVCVYVGVFVFIECLCLCAKPQCVCVFSAPCTCMSACPSLRVCLNEHLSVSLMPYSIRSPILCVQLIARTSASVCVFPYPGKSLHAPAHQCSPSLAPPMPAAHTHTHLTSHFLSRHTYP